LGPIDEGVTEEATEPVAADATDPRVDDVSGKEFIIVLM